MAVGGFNPKQLIASQANIAKARIDQTVAQLDHLATVKQQIEDQRQAAAQARAKAKSDRQTAVTARAQQEAKAADARATALEGLLPKAPVIRTDDRGLQGSIAATSAENVNQLAGLLAPNPITATGSTVALPGGVPQGPPTGDVFGVNRTDPLARGGLGTDIRRTPQGAYLETTRTPARTGLQGLDAANAIFGSLFGRPLLAQQRQRELPEMTLAENQERRLQAEAVRADVRFQQEQQDLQISRRRDFVKNVQTRIADGYTSDESIVVEASLLSGDIATAMEVLSSRESNTAKNAKAILAKNIADAGKAEYDLKAAKLSVEQAEAIADQRSALARAGVILSPETRRMSDAELASAIGSLTSGQKNESDPAGFGKLVMLQNEMLARTNQFLFHGEPPGAVAKFFGATGKEFYTMPASVLLELMAVADGRRNATPEEENLARQQITETTGMQWKTLENGNIQPDFLANDGLSNPDLNNWVVLTNMYRQQRVLEEKANKALPASQSSALQPNQGKAQALLDEAASTTAAPPPITPREKARSAGRAVRQVGSTALGTLRDFATGQGSYTPGPLTPGPISEEQAKELRRRLSESLGGFSEGIRGR